MSCTVLFHCANASMVMRIVQIGDALILNNAVLKHHSSRKTRPRVKSQNLSHRWRRGHES
jgi:hypothetical protein